MTDIGFRTVVRGLMVAGGLVFLLRGVLDGSTFDIGLGAVAIVVGGVGLLWEWRQQSDGDDESENL